MALPSSSSSSSLKPEQMKGLLFPFILVTSLFFFWGFVHGLDPILIPHLRKTFTLNYLQSSLVDFSVFIAYFLMALPAGFVMRKYGYKSGIILGLLLFGIGSLLFIPAANTREYALFLGSLFIIACGLTFLETAANPYANVLGPKESSTQRLNFAQSFNGLAVVVAPLIGGKLILSENTLTEAQKAALSPQALDAYLTAEASTVKMPYLILGLIILTVAVIFAFTKLPEIKEEEGEKSSIKKAIRHKHLVWAIVAQFFYVGAQVCVHSFFINVATKAANISDKTGSYYVGLGYGLAFMLGRFAGTFIMKYISPNKLLAIYAAINMCNFQFGYDYRLYIDRYFVLYVDHVSYNFLAGHRGAWSRYQNWFKPYHYVNCGWRIITIAHGPYCRYHRQYSKRLFYPINLFCCSILLRLERLQSKKSITLNTYIKIK
jgi:FHS family L-fucose permease-like MFS transporter